MSKEYIDSWLFNVHTPPPQVTRQTTTPNASPDNWGTYPADKSCKSRKRRRPLTPDSIVDDSMSSQTTPRKRRDANDDTPRPNKRLREVAGSESTFSRNSSTSQRSATVSTCAHLSHLELSAEGIETREMATMKRTGTLKTFYDSIMAISRCKGILSPSLQPFVNAQHPVDGVGDMAEDLFFDKSRDDIGHTPSLKQVIYILRRAGECQGQLHSEHSWNATVHLPLLEMALYPDPLEPEGLVQAMVMTSASIIPDYLPSAGPSKKVDLCVYIDTVFDTKPDAQKTEDTKPDAQKTEDAKPDAQKTEDAITRIRDFLPRGVINFTDYHPLRKRPIALCIETKKTGEGWDGATLQLGIWQAAHWNLLDCLQQDLKKSPDKFVDFLPGIIIQGHDWHLVIATREGKKTIFWSKQTLGTTSNITGIYQIIHGLQIIRKWAEDTYWPALKRVLLSERWIDT